MPQALWRLELGLSRRLKLGWLRSDEGPRARRQPLEDVGRCPPRILAVGAKANQNVAPRAWDLADGRSMPARTASAQLASATSNRIPKSTEGRDGPHTTESTKMSTSPACCVTSIAPGHRPYTRPRGLPFRDGEDSSAWCRTEPVGGPPRPLGKGSECCSCGCRAVACKRALLRVRMTTQ